MAEEVDDQEPENVLCEACSQHLGTSLFVKERGRHVYKLNSEQSYVLGNNAYCDRWCRLANRLIDALIPMVGE